MFPTSLMLGDGPDSCGLYESSQHNSTQAGESGSVSTDTMQHVAVIPGSQIVLRVFIS
jgi:hypothetical protein